MATKRKPGRPTGKTPRTVLTTALAPQYVERLREFATLKRWTIRAALDDLIERGAKS